MARLRYEANNGTLWDNMESAMEQDKNDEFFRKVLLAVNKKSGWASENTAILRTALNTICFTDFWFELQKFMDQPESDKVEEAAYAFLTKY